MTVRRTLPFDEWPAADKAAWQAAITAGGLLDRPGGGAHWRPATRRWVMESYGAWLQWLMTQHEPNPDVGDLAGRSLDRLRAYVVFLQIDYAPATVENRLVGLDRALKVMAPDLDRSALRRAIKHVHDSRGGRARKRHRIVEPTQLMDLGHRLMAEAEDVNHRFLRPVLRAVRFRDGLIIALLAARPLRRRNFAALELGRHLLTTGDTWWITVPGTETKTHRPIEVPFPVRLKDALLRYLKEHRPVLLGLPLGEDAPCSGPVWISSRTTGQLSPHTMNLNVCTHTRRAFGRSINLHLFRDCAATAIAIHDPEHVRIAANVLGHSRFTTTERYYNQAHGLQAARDYHGVLDSLRRDARDRERLGNRSSTRE